jgi:hypothetical protein
MDEIFNSLMKYLNDNPNITLRANVGIPLEGEGLTILPYIGGNQHAVYMDGTQDLSIKVQIIGKDLDQQKLISEMYRLIEELDFLEEMPMSSPRYTFIGGKITEQPYLLKSDETQYWWYTCTYEFMVESNPFYDKREPQRHTF